MPITPTNTIEIPAKPATTADKVWILSLNVNAPTPEGKSRAAITVVPYSSTTNEPANAFRKTFVIDDLFTEAGQTPEIGAALLAVYAGVDAYIKKNNLL